jgi:hypothetical protein
MAESRAQMIVKSVGVWSAARLYAAILAAFGLLVGIPFALFSLIGAGLAPEAQSWMGPVFGLGAIVFLPILYGVMGLVVGAVFAVLYNFFASIVGGLSVDVE